MVICCVFVSFGAVLLLTVEGGFVVITGGILVVFGSILPSLQPSSLHAQM